MDVHRLLLFFLHVICSESLQDFTANVDETQRLQCKHKNQKKIEVIGWEIKVANLNAIASIKYDGSEKIKFDNPKYKRKVTIDLPSGDLVLPDVEIKDEGNYQCFVLINSFSENTEGNYNFTVLVPPSAVTMLCSDDAYELPSKPCDDIDDDKITSITCIVISKPGSSIKWVYSDCDKHIKEPSKCQSYVGRSSKCETTVSNVCETKYFCIATYVIGPGHEKVITSETVDLSTGSVKSGAIIGGCVAFVVVLLLVLGVIYFLWKRQNDKKKEDAEKADQPLNEMDKEEPKTEMSNNSVTKDDTEKPKQDVQPAYLSNDSTGENKHSPEDMQVARQDSFNERKEDDPFLNDGKGLDLKEDDTEHEFRRDDDRQKSVVPAYMNNPAKMSIHTRQFYNIAKGGGLGPNKKVKYTKVEPDGTKRIFEVESTDDNSSNQLGDVNPRLLGNVRSESPIVEEPESNDEESMTPKK